MFENLNNNTADDECERLRKRISDLEHESDEQRKRIAEVEAERDGYLKSVYGLLKAQHTPEEFEQWGKEVEGWTKGEGQWFTFEEIMAEIENDSEKEPCPCPNKAHSK